MIQIDMDMPKNCDDCKLLEWALIGDDPPYCNVTGKYVYCGNTQRPSWCPLIEVKEKE